MENLAIRLQVKSNELSFKQIAEEIGISPCYLSQLMAKPLSPANQIRILNAIQRLKE